MSALLMRAVIPRLDQRNSTEVVPSGGLKGTTSVELCAPALAPVSSARAASLTVGSLMAGSLMAGSLVRRSLWRGVFGLTGGLRVRGHLPDRPCVVVANHSSHADTAALLASLPARRRPAVAAAADYWFDGAPWWRTFLGKHLTSAFPVRRSGGGSADLQHAIAMLHSGRDVIIFPEGTRSRDGSLGHFHTGAARLAQAAGVPLVPVAICGTSALLPVHGRPLLHHRTPVALHIGEPATDTADASSAVETMTAVKSHRRPIVDSRIRRNVARFAGSRTALWVLGLWAFAEALVWPLLPEFALAVVAVAAPKRSGRLIAATAIGSVAGGAVMYGLAARGITLPAALTTPRMHATVARDFAADGAAAVAQQPASGIPFKVYGAAAGHAHVGIAQFVAASIPARAWRITAAGVLAGAFGAATHRLRRWYPYYVAVFVLFFAAALGAVIRAWS